MMGSLGTKYIENKVMKEVSGIQDEVQGWGASMREALAGCCHSLGFGGGDDAGSDAGSSSSSFGGSRGGKESLFDVLERFGLPPGLFPKNHKAFSLKEGAGEEGGTRLEVRMPYIMEVKFPDETKMRFNKKVVCTVSMKELAGVDGMKLHGMTWGKVQGVVVESKTKLAFRTKTKKTKKISLFDYPKEGIETEKY